MKDRFGRTIDYIRISITDRCNLRCRYCMPDGIQPMKREEILTYEEIEKLVTAAARLGISKCKITGGEPLVRAGCPELIGRIRRIEGIEQVTLTTNGILLEEQLEALAENGLDAVNISLDTLRPEVYQEITGFDRLAKVQAGVEKAIERIPQVKINAVLQKGVNEEEWRDLLLLARDQKLDVRFIEMMPIGYGKEFPLIGNDTLLERIRQEFPDLYMEEQWEKHGNGPAVYYHIPGFQGSIGFISAMHGKFCGSCNRIRLTAQGMLKPCLCYGQSLDLKQILRQEQGDADAIGEALLKAISEKPEQHCFEKAGEITEQHKMVEIGG